MQKLPLLITYLNLTLIFSLFLVCLIPRSLEKFILAMEHKQERKEELSYFSKILPRKYIFTISTEVYFLLPRSQKILLENGFKTRCEMDNIIFSETVNIKVTTTHTHTDKCHT